MKKDVLKRERTLLDDTLTVIFLCLIALVFYHVYDDTQWLIVFLMSLASVAVLIVVTKKAARGVGSFVSRRLLNSSWTPIADRNPLQKRQTMKKFSDQAWQLAIHSSMSALEYYIIFRDTEGSPDNNFFDNTSHCWFPYEAPQVHSNLMRTFYLVQLSIWIVTCFSHRFLEARHKDYYQMCVRGWGMGGWVVAGREHPAASRPPAGFAVHLSSLSQPRSLRALSVG